MEIQVILSFREPPPGSANVCQLPSLPAAVIGCFHTHWWEEVTASYTQMKET